MVLMHNLWIVGGWVGFYKVNHNNKMEEGGGGQTWGWNLSKALKDWPKPFWGVVVSIDDNILWHTQ